MPDVPYVIRMRERDLQRRERNPAGRLALGCALLLSLFASLAAILFGLVYSTITKDLPSLAALPDLLDPPNGILRQPTRLYDRTGDHVLLTLKNPGAAESEYLSLDPDEPNYLPASLISATIATVDPNFWQHPGFTMEGIRQNAHPTLAQQLVSDLLLWEEPPGLRRALRERVLAAQITSHFGRQQVLTWYLNSVNYGRLAFGADAAARVYFGKPAARLTVAEAAMLAAIAQAPALNPLDSEQAALENQRKVLDTMLFRGAINAHEYQQAEKEVLKFRSPVVSQENAAPAFANLVMDQLGRRMDLARLERGGLRVITTLNYDLQLQVACAAASHLSRLTNQPEMTTTLAGDECQAARLLPTLQQARPLPTEGLAASVIVYDPSRGEVLSMVGEPSSGLDPAHAPGRPGGTLLTPFLYLTAFARGLSPAALLWDVPSLNTIDNPDGQFHGPVRLRTAMANDLLVPAEKLLAQIGAGNVQETVSQLGLDFGIDAEQVISSLFQDGKITLLEISQAYGVLANQGILAGDAALDGDSYRERPVQQPTTILSVQDTLGRVWWGGDPSDPNRPVAQHPVINPQLAYLVTDVLKDEPARWLTLRHPNPLEIGRPVAAKLGQTLDGQNAWTVGYTPQLLVSVWLGGRQATGGGENSGGILPESAAALWHAIIQYAARDLPPDDWPLPPGVSRLSVCNPSGLLPSADCPDVVSEVFLNGTEPTQPDNLYKSLQINRETGRLATAFTPPDRVDERTYLILPPEAAEWASLASLPIPPTEYDIILANDEITPDVAITSPVMLAQVRGDIEVLGSAGGDGFAYYRLQVGKGLNPQQWIQIGEDVDTPVDQGRLGVWDTENLDGLYTLQLQVVRQDQRLDSAITQVTVDNQPPQVEIVSPIADQVSIVRDGQLILLVEADDNLSVRSVDFLIDGDLVDQRIDPPYAVPWEGVPGDHTLRVVVTDQAGNETEAETHFVVQ